MFLFVAILFIAGCATTNQFSRVGGTKNADLHGIRIYNGQPPTEFPYQSLGVISADGHGPFILARLDNALENLTLKAKDLGANAIINWKIKPQFGWAMKVEGEAVVFEKFPNATNDHL